MMEYKPGFCQYFGFLFTALCVIRPQHQQDLQIVRRSPGLFEVEFQWNYVNFTWPSSVIYEEAVRSGRYIPENIPIAGIKFYKTGVYMALPKVRPGNPVTMAWMNLQTASKTNPLLKPFPSWSRTTGTNCDHLQNVQSMEISPKGIMWVLDGIRFNNYTSCPPKLILLDLNQRGRIVHSYTFEEKVTPHKGSFLNDIVIDGDYAYITDASNFDPGLIVYSRKNNNAYKFRDRSMFPEPKGTNYEVDNVHVGNYLGIDGIALSPLPLNKNEPRLVYYTALNGKSMYALSTQILKSERFLQSDQWRLFVKYVGAKSPSDGLIIDNTGDMYYGLLPDYSVGKWNIYESFDTAETIDTNDKEIIWPDSFGMDSIGNLYLLCNGIHRYLNLSAPLLSNDVIKFRILKLYTGKKNYMFPNNPQ